MKRQKLITTVAIIILLSATLLLLVNNFQNSKTIKSLSSKIDDLESELEDANNKISQMEDELSEVQHFDDAESAGNGNRQSGVSFTGKVIETKIEGEFSGWDGETIFKMINGSIWQQCSYAYIYHYSFMPNVIIYKKSGSYYLKVEGIDDEIQVQRVN